MTKEDIDATEAPLLDHLIELRKRLVYCVIGFIATFMASFFFSSDILGLLILPFKWGTGSDVGLISIKLLGVFLVKLKIAMFGGMFISFPLIATQLYRFVAPGLYKNERQALFPYLVATPIFFVLGAAMVYFVLLPFAPLKFSPRNPPLKMSRHSSRCCARPRRTTTTSSTPHASRCATSSAIPPCSPASLSTSKAQTNARSCSTCSSQPRAKRPRSSA